MTGRPFGPGMQHSTIAASNPASREAVASNPQEWRIVHKRCIPGNFELRLKRHHHRPARRHYQLCSVRTERMRLLELSRLRRWKCYDECIERADMRVSIGFDRLVALDQCLCGWRRIWHGFKNAMHGL